MTHRIRTPTRVLLLASTVAVVFLCVLYGSWLTERRLADQIATSEAQLAALRDEVKKNSLDIRKAQVGATTGTRGEDIPEAVRGSSTALLVDEIKRQLQTEMGLLPVQLLRERRGSFVELNAFDNHGRSSYGTAGYLGVGYFITVKHVVIALGESNAPQARRIISTKIRYKGKDLAARVVDSGNAHSEVHLGDWAIVKVEETIDLPPLTIDTEYGYQFAEPIFRLGNDYSKGIILSTGYIGQRMSNGLVTCLTDGHPGVSGGGVLDREGNLVGIPVGRLESDYRFSFILPLRREMFRKVPAVTRVASR
jgi:hypothetical protein